MGEALVATTTFCDRVTGWPVVVFTRHGEPWRLLLVVGFE